MPVFYIVKRVGTFLLIIWLAATLNFFLPRLGGMNPVAEKLMFTAALGGNLHAGMQDMVKEYESKFGLNRPLWEQYLTYLADTSRFEFNYSIVNYPRKVSDMILEGLPWTFTLLTVTTIISFVIGNLLGAFQAWPGAPRWLQFLMPPLLALNAIPFFLLGLVLVYVVGFSMQLLPLYGGYTAGSIPQWSLSFIIDVVRHAILPSVAIILGSLGGWALGMRAMMVTTQGEDYVVFAEAKGLQDRTIFRQLRHSQRHASAGHGAGSGARTIGVRGRARRDRLWLSGHRHPALSGDQGLRLFPGAGNRLHPDHLDRAGDAHPRPGLSAHRPAHRLSEGVT